MKEARWVLFAMLGTACGSTAVDTSQNEQLAVLAEENANLRTELTSANEALAVVTARLDALEAHERLVAAEMIDDGLTADGVSDDVEGLASQLAVTRLDALDDGASASCEDICVTGTELADALADYVTEAEIAPLATRVEVEASDEALRQWVIDQDYLTAADLVGFATEGWVADQGFATVFYVDTQDSGFRQWVADQGYAAGADLTTLAGRVSAMEGDYVQTADLGSYATQAWVVSNYLAQGDLDVVVADLAGVNLALDDHEVRLTALEADPITATAVAAADHAVTAWVTAQGYASVDALDDEVASRVEDADALRAALGEKQDIVSANLTLLVTHGGPWDGESTFPDVASALNWLNPRAIAPGVTVTIQVGPGTYSGQPTIDVSHPNGDRIQIVGDVLNPSEVVMEFSDSAVQVRDGAHLGGIDGFVLRWVSDDPSQLVAASNARGIHANRGGSADVGPSMTVDGFFDCLHAENGSMIRTGSMSCLGNVHAAVSADGLSAVIAPDLQVVGGERAMAIRNHSFGRAEGLLATGITYIGFEAIAGSTIYAPYAWVEEPLMQINAGHGSYVFAGL